MLRMVIVPLVFSSIVSGVASIGNTGRLGRLGGKALFYYVFTTLVATLTGLVVVNLVKPGVGAELGLTAVPEGLKTSQTSLLAVFQGLFPDNPVKAAAEGQMIQIIFFAIILGVFITRVDEKVGAPLLAFFSSFFEVMMKMTRFIILLTPVGAFGLVGSIIARTGFAPFVPLGLYALCVLTGLILHAFITLPLMIRIIGGLRPIKFVRAVAPALMTAFSTSSSSATLPLAMECAEKRAGISNQVASFVLPIGTTMNMNGTALYECVAVIFIAQYYFSHGQVASLGIAQQATVVLTAILVAIGAPGIPMAGLVMMSIILNAVGLPLEGVGLILAVDRVLDMCRTTVNVWGDLCATAIIAVSEGESVLTGPVNQETEFA